MKEKNPLPCTGCGRPVIKNKLEPKYKTQSKLLVTHGPLLAYFYTCPHCKTKSVYDKDYVRSVWEGENLNKLTARKL